MRVWGCAGCGEVMRPFGVGSGEKICQSCGGSVLNLQEAFDKIIQLKREIEELSGLEPGELDYEE